MDGKQLVRVARIGKPHGIRGEVTVEVFTDSPNERFLKGQVFTTQGPAGARFRHSSLRIENARWHNKILLLQFDGVTDRTAAESLRNSYLYAGQQDTGEHEEGWYADDLIGLAVHEGSLNTPIIGKVTSLITGEAQDLIEIRLSDGLDVLIPFVEEIVPEIDEERGAIIITPPPGLLELNQD